RAGRERIGFVIEGDARPPAWNVEMVTAIGAGDRLQDEIFEAGAKGAELDLHPGKGQRIAAGHVALDLSADPRGLLRRGLVFRGDVGAPGQRQDDCKNTDEPSSHRCSLAIQPTENSPRSLINVDLRRAPSTPLERTTRVARIRG